MYGSGGGLVDDELCDPLLFGTGVTFVQYVDGDPGYYSL